MIIAKPICHDFQSNYEYFVVSLKEKYPKVLSVKTKHYINDIVIPSGLSNKEFVFHKREGLPIKLAAKSFLIITIRCDHEINHEFRIPIESFIEWKIVNGIQDGAFKHGHGLNAKYSDTDNENCVIYYPIIRGAKDDYNDKEIPILIKIRSNRVVGFIENLSTNNFYESKNDLLDEDDTTRLLLILRLKQKQGFLNKMHYESSIIVKHPDQKELKCSFSDLITNNKNDENSNFLYSFDELSETFSIENKYDIKCTECKLGITFQSSSLYLETNQSKINIDTNRFLSSEYIKLSNSTSESVYSAKDRLNIEFEIKNKDKSIGKFRICNCPVIKTKEAFWTTTAGSFPCMGNGNSIIYCSLEEKELSKSPITLKLYERDLFKQKDEESFYLVDEKKIWILRKGIMGG